MEGIIIIDYLQNGRTVTGAYCAELKQSMRRRGKLTSGVNLLQDNAPAHNNKHPWEHP